MKNISGLEVQGPQWTLAHQPLYAVLSKLGVVFWGCLWVGPAGCSWGCDSSDSPGALGHCRAAPREELRPGGQAVPPVTGLLRSARACSSVTLSRGTHLPFELSVTPRLYKVHFPFFCVIKVHMCIIKNLAKVTVMKYLSFWNNLCYFDVHLSR